jgi:hypothetical protein
VSTSERLVIGWREWVALPKLQLPAIKAKVDTGAKTSSLHAFEIHAFQDRGELKVRFKVHPLQGRRDVVVTCVAPVVDYRTVSDSGGHREKRYVIETELAIGELRLPIEITLANRETMSHRMLLGRSAMQAFMIEPSHSYLLGKPAKIKSQYGNQQNAHAQSLARKLRSRTKTKTQPNARRKSRKQPE